MPATLTKDGNLVYLKIDGFVTLNDGKKIQDKTNAFIEEGDCDKVIVDITEMSHEYKIFEIAEIFGRIPEIFPPHVRHAIVFSRETHDISIAEFSATYSYNRAINIKLFEDMAEAKEWLGV